MQSWIQKSEEVMKQEVKVTETLNHKSLDGLAQTGTEGADLHFQKFDRAARAEEKVRPYPRLGLWLYEGGVGAKGCTCVGVWLLCAKVDSPLQAHRRTGTGRQTDTQTPTHRHTDRQTQTQTDTHTDRQTDTHTHTHTLSLSPLPVDVSHVDERQAA